MARVKAPRGKAEGLGRYLEGEPRDADQRESCVLTSGGLTAGVWGAVADQLRDEGVEVLRGRRPRNALHPRRS